MDVESGLEPSREPNLDEFLLARIAEDKRIAVDAAAVGDRAHWDAAGGPPAVAEHTVRHDPRRVLAECYDWFTEGFDTQDLQEAKALLEGVS